MHYTTLSPGTDLESTIEERRSVFTTRLVRVDTEEEARRVVEEQRRAHHDARHHVSAFVLGPDREIQRSSDDGEPGGTAGVPSLEVLLRTETDGVADLSDVCAVTSRWFGGIKLGAGGLVRTYSESVNAALALAPRVRRTRTRTFSLTLPMATAGARENLIRTDGLDVASVSYRPEGVEVSIAVTEEPQAGDRLAARLAGLLGAPVDLLPGPTGWSETPLDVEPS